MQTGEVKDLWSWRTALFHPFCGESRMKHGGSCDRRFAGWSEGMVYDLSVYGSMVNLRCMCTHIHIFMIYRRGFMSTVLHAVDKETLCNLISCRTATCAYTNTYMHILLSSTISKPTLSSTEKKAASSCVKARFFFSLPRSLIFSSVAQKGNNIVDRYNPRFFFKSQPVPHSPLFLSKILLLRLWLPDENIWDMSHIPCPPPPFRIPLTNPVSSPTLTQPLHICNSVTTPSALASRTNVGKK